jgi:hypothetical protein
MPATIIEIKSKPMDSQNPMNSGDNKYKMEIADLIKKAIDLCEQSGSKMVVEHLQMALKELESGGMEEDDDFGEMMADKGMGFGESMMKKSESEGYSKPSE